MEEEQKVVVVENAEPVVENVEKVVEDVSTPAETKTEEKITTPIAPKKDPKKVEAGRLSAISRAAKKRQREQLGVQEEPIHSYWNPSSILYFGVPSIFLLGMFLWTIKEKKKELVVEYTPAERNEEQRLPEAKKKRETVSLFE